MHFWDPFWEFFPFISADFGGQKRCDFEANVDFRWVLKLMHFWGPFWEFFHCISANFPGLMPHNTVTHLHCRWVVKMEAFWGSISAVFPLYFCRFGGSKMCDFETSFGFSWVAKIHAFLGSILGVSPLHVCRFWGSKMVSFWDPFGLPPLFPQNLGVKNVRFWEAIWDRFGTFWNSRCQKCDTQIDRFKGKVGTKTQRIKWSRWVGHQEFNFASILL